MIFGAHVSTAGGVFKAPARARDLGITAIQIFAKNQRQWHAAPLADSVVEQWHEQLEEHGITHAVSHTSYLINLCAPDPLKRQKSLDSFTDELERAERLGLTHAVIHPGSHLKEGEEWGVKTIAESLNEVHARTPGAKVKTTLEITAGQGTNLGHTFEQLAGMIDGVADKERVAVCYDTCHGHSAGYDLTTREGYEKVWGEFDRLIGLERLQVFHLNDTKKELASNVDRHANIGEGLLGADLFRFLLTDERFRTVPAILETPRGEEGYPEDLKRLKELERG